MKQTNDSVDIDFERIARELIREIRGKQSTSRLSQRLGHKFNQVDRWEKASRKIYWRDFWNLCKILNLPLRNAIQVNHFSRSSPGAKAAPLMRALQGQQTILDFSKTLGRSRLTVSRWLSGKTELPLAEVFRAMHIVHNNVGEFIDLIVPLAKLVYAAERLGPRLRERHLIVRRPWATPIMAALRHPDCPPQPKTPAFLRGLLGVNLQAAERIIEELLSLGLITLDEDNYLRLSPDAQVGMMPTDIAHVREYWLRVVSGAVGPLSADLTSDSQKNVARFFCLGTGPEGWKKIVEQQRLFMESVINIVNTSEGELTELKILNLQIFDLPEIGKFQDISASGDR